MAHQSSKARAFVTTYSAESPPQVVDIRDPDDLAPSDTQPTGVDDEAQSFDEALMG